MKTDPEVARADLSDAAEVVYLLAGLLAPVVPKLSEKLFEQLGAAELTFENVTQARYSAARSEPPASAPRSRSSARLEESTVKLIDQCGARKR